MADEFFPIIATVSLLLYLLSTWHGLPAGVRPWLFRIAVVLIGGAMLFAIAGSIFWFATEPNPPAAPQEVPASDA